MAAFTMLVGCASSAPTSVTPLPQYSKGVYGADHVGLTVTKLEETERFFREVLSFETIGKDPSYPSLVLSNGHIIITLWLAEDPVTALPFNRRKNVGLHHLAIAVDSFESLDLLFEKVAAFPGVEIEFSPENLGEGPTKHTIFQEPSGNRLELIHRSK